MLTRRRFIAAGAAVGALAAVGGALPALAEPLPAPRPPLPPEVAKRIASCSGFELGDTVRILGSSAANGVYRVVGTSPLQLWDGRSMLAIGVGDL